MFDVTGKNPLLDVALELERIALEDEYFVKRKLYPNVDFYSGLIYQAMELPVTMFPVLFAIPRTVGWLAQWQELDDAEQKIARPRQIYTGDGARDFVPMHDRESRSFTPRAAAPRPGLGNAGSVCFPFCSHARRPRLNQTGRTQTYTCPDAGDHRAADWTTAFWKSPVDGSVEINGLQGVVGDEQADRIHHGGPDKAILLYSADHFPAWLLNWASPRSHPAASART